MSGYARCSSGAKEELSPVTAPSEMTGPQTYVWGYPWISISLQSCCIYWTRPRDSASDIRLALLLAASADSGALVMGPRYPGSITLGGPS
jgi:hypothetical protein